MVNKDRVHIWWDLMYFARRCALSCHRYVRPIISKNKWGCNNWFRFNVIFHQSVMDIPWLCNISLQVVHTKNWNLFLVLLNKLLWKFMLYQQGSPLKTFTSFWNLASLVLVYVWKHACKMMLPFQVSSIFAHSASGTLGQERCCLNSWRLPYETSNLSGAVYFRDPAKCPHVQPHAVSFGQYWSEFLTQDSSSNLSPLVRDSSVSDNSKFTKRGWGTGMPGRTSATRLSHWVYSEPFKWSWN